MIVTSYEPGMPCWADLVTADVEKTSAFYSGLFGWRFPKATRHSAAIATPR